MRSRNFALRMQSQLRSTGVLTAIASVVIAPDLIQDQAPSPQAPGQSPIIISPWTKFCLKGQEPDTKEVCFTGKEGRFEVAPRAYDGPPTDPELFKAQQQKLQAELQRRAEAARKKLEEHEKKLRGEEPK